MTRKPGLETAPLTADALADNVIELSRVRPLSTLGSTVISPHAMNAREINSIKAMTAYVAHNQNVREDTVRAFIEAEFSVDSITSIRRDDFERVIAFLVDLRCDLLKN